MLLCRNGPGMLTAQDAFPTRVWLASRLQPCKHLQVDAGLDALAGALAAGFDDFRTVRTDSSLDALRKSKKFKTLIDRYDEPLINEGAIKCVR